MSRTNTRFKLTALTAAILATQGMSSFAQQSTDVDPDSVSPDMLEEIVVTGIRGALQRSLENKRDSQQIMDTINAEDMGKNTDQNIADALGRVTGVSVVSRDGEGSTITVRGAGANQNNITLNGQQLTSTDFSQAVDLSAYSSDILSKLEVIKTPSADQDEGSLGATINLVTVRPLDKPTDEFSATIQGRYNDFSEKDNYKLQLAGTKKFLDDTLGLALTAYTETNDYRKDQYRVQNFEAKDVNIARDQNGNIISGIRAIEQAGINYELFDNSSERYGATLGLQWAPTDSTELMFDATYANQTTETSRDSFLIRNSDFPNLIEGETWNNDYADQVASFTDPQEDWWTVDTNNLTFTKQLGRFNVGDISRSVGGNEQENASATLKLEQDISDNFRMSAMAGYSSSTSESLPSRYTNMQNWRQVPTHLLFNTGADIEPVGFDCNGDLCAPIYGGSYVDLGDNLFNYTDPETGDPMNGGEDNIVYTGFNPTDLNSFHLGNISEADVSVEDTISNFQLDFDYDLDFAGITTIEFGGKISQRKKLVDQQNYTYNSNTTSEIIYDSEGNPVAIPGGPLSDIRAVDIQRGESLAYDDFLSSLGLASLNWATIDVEQAYNMVVSDPELYRTVDPSNTRETTLDSSAAYLKFNFSYLDDRLTGDIGVRYVKTKVEAIGASGAVYHDFPDNADESEFSSLTLRQLRDTSLPECPTPSNWSNDPAERFDQIPAYENKFSRIDGTGWDTSAGPDPSTWTRMPMFDPNGDGVQDACHDPVYAQWSIDSQQPGFDQNTYPYRPTWNNLWRYADVSTSRNNGWDSSLTSPNIEWNGTIDASSIDQYTVLNQQNKSIGSFATENSHSYENILPSLNLNYAFTDDIIGRMAVSKTMTRPEIDELRPGFRINELWATYWGTLPSNPGNVTMYNTKLEPLESQNLDLSLEWYFNDTSMVSMALFYKDMKNFTDTETAQTYITDVREVEGTFNADDLVLLADESQANSGLDSCMPIRFTTQSGFGGPLAHSDDYEQLCNTYNINKIINGKGAEIRGIELGYSQTYDFLPGYFLSGLGVQANYTYQDSEYEADFSSIDPDRLLPTYPVADTPEHTYNLTAFWEQDGHQVRLSYRGSSDSLVGNDWNTGQSGRTWYQGSLWNEGRDTVDLSATYAINDSMDLTFQAINLTDALYRTYYTNRELPVQQQVGEDGSISYVAMEEGNPLDGDAPTDRTVSAYKVGATFRLGLRMVF
ncbi:TonB-dependent receptor domain-containing protein [Gilvimarinus polysaccharolyticus]|uniref:TonB-dependent receptor domain-containing protein n=1 Tax=Gilvimarinus polysaccharolyticus TaxID=863921 RepID=UPI0006736AD8|nr:TonB-dependent receptor [Gilvimarinus polysaccharolyticus]